MKAICIHKLGTTAREFLATSAEDRLSNLSP